jgi:ATP-dependent protease ClpP protease subunit
MAKAILIYDPIYDYSARDFITAINDIEDVNEALSILINCDGGDPQSAFGMISEFSNYSGPKDVQVHGKANSMALFFLCYTDNVSALDVSEFILHRAAMASWYENSEEFDDDDLQKLKSINDALKAAFIAKVDIDKFHALKQVRDNGITIDKVFSMDSRIDVRLSAKDAKKIGLIKSINTISPTVAAKIAASFESNLFEKYGLKKEVQAAKPPKQVIKEVITNKVEKMTREEFKLAHPEVFAAVLQEGVEAERDRVGSWMVYNEIDPTAVKAGIDSGKAIGATAQSQFALQAVSGKKLTAIAGEGAGEVVTDKPAEDEVVETEADKVKNSAIEALKKSNLLK